MQRRVICDKRQMSTKTVTAICLWLLAGACGPSRIYGLDPAGAGGSTGRAGAPGVAGGPGAAGEGGLAGAGGAAFFGAASCFAWTAAISPRIRTVGIVTFTTSGGAVTEGKIDFGLTAAYGMTAPVDLTTPDHRTLLLGMKASTTYHYRITLSVDQDTCVSDDATIRTGTLPPGLQQPVITTQSTASPLSGGFLVTGQYVVNAGVSASPAYILDADGDFVWAFGGGRNISGVRMSYDGKSVWVNNVNVPSGQASVHRVSMDGLVDEDLSPQFTGLNHQLTVLPDETVAFYAYGANGCDDIKERAPGGTVRTIVNARTARGGASPCHVNNIQYEKQDDTLVFSDLNTSTVTKIDRATGKTVLSLGGAIESYAGMPWQGGQHGIDLLGLDRLLIFANNSTQLPDGGKAGGSGDGSFVLEVALDNGARSYTTRRIFKSTVQTNVLGDVQIMPNGNYVIAHSTRGVLQEVSPSGILLQTWTWPLPSAFGYIEKRATLYGPPPR
jgi:hypothetical protein